ncbi:MAG: SAM-dependent methyltransferase [Aquificaceae bacterium]
MISFRDWMSERVREYYRSDFRKDFFTAPELDRVFGYSLAYHIGELLKDYEDPCLIELGGGSGALAYDILTYLREKEPKIYRRLRYYIYDFSPELVELQRKRLRVFEDKVFWTDRLLEVRGLILSNEFFDCLPVHVVKEGKELFLEGGKEVWKELSNPSIEEFLRRMGYQGLTQVVEVCLDCLDFLKGVAEKLKEGYHLVVDYGYTSRDIARFPEGTVVGYRSHRVYTKPSEGMDITAQVNFSLLEEYGKDFGLFSLYIKKLGDFLLSTPIFTEELHRLALSEAPEDIERLSRLKTLLLSMGETFKVLLQRKL